MNAKLIVRSALAGTLLAGALILAGCAASTSTAPAAPGSSLPTPTATPAPKAQDATSIPPSTMVNPASVAAQKALGQRLGIDPATVKLISVDLVDWPDGCLGIAREGVMCAQIVTPGYKIILEAAGKQYEYRTSENGAQVVAADSAKGTGEQLPSGVILNWKRSGGIVGHCDNLSIYDDDSAELATCRNNGTPARFQLTDAQAQQVKDWRARFQSFTTQSSDNGAADGMNISLSFQGSGTQAAPQADQDAMQRFAADIVDSAPKN